VEELHLTFWIQQDPEWHSGYSNLATGWTVWGLNSGRVKSFSSSTNIQTGSGAHPPSRSVGTMVVHGVEWLRHRVEVGNEWGCTSSPPICHLGVDKGHFLLLCITYLFKNLGA